MLSHMLDGQLFGLQPAGHHAGNLFLHLANTGLLYVLIRRLFSGGRPTAFFVAAFFAIHPLHVESVAWVSSRKDLLSGFFFLLTLLAYERFNRSKELRRRWYLITLGLTLAGLFSKAMLVTIPGVLLLLDIWPLERLKSEGGARDLVWRTLKDLRLWVEKLPFIGAGLAISALALFMRRERLNSPERDLLSFGERWLRAVDGSGMYLAKTVWPFDLTVAYKYFPAVSVLRATIFLVLLAAINLAAIAVRKRYPSFFVGWFWYLGMLAPVAGLMQTGPQELAYRYTYLPLIGISLIIAWGLPVLYRWILPAQAQHFKPWPAILAISLLLGWWTFTCRACVGVWRNEETLLRHALRINPSNWLALNNLGYELLRRGQSEPALKYLNQAFALSPNKINIKSNLAQALSREFSDSESLKRAITLFSEVLASDPNREQDRINLGITLAKAGRNKESLQVFAEVVRRDPEQPKGHYNYAQVLLTAGRPHEARKELESALRLDPGYQLARDFLARLENLRQP